MFTLQGKFSTSIKGLITGGVFFGYFASLLAKRSFKESVRSHYFTKLICYCCL